MNKEERLRKEVLKIVNKEKIVKASKLYKLVFKSEEFTLTKLLLKMDDEGIIRLKIINPRINSLFDYLFSIHSLYFWFVTVIVVITLFLTLLNITEWPWVILRYIAGSLYVLFLPGFSLIEALYPRDEDLSDLERFALSIGLSLAIVPLIGLILNYTPWGIRLTPVSISLAIFTEIMITVSLVRKYNYYMFLKEELLQALKHKFK